MNKILIISMLFFSSMSMAFNSNEKELPLKWEIIIPAYNYETTERLKVFGGWLVKFKDSGKNLFVQSFVPDKNHEWVINGLK